MSILLDANVLIALSVADHVHHDAVEDWLSDQDPSAALALCAITEGALVRTLLRTGVDTSQAQQVVAALHENARFEFWSASISYQQVDMAGVIGHRQVTDVYPAALARSRWHTGDARSRTRCPARRRH